MIKMAVVLTSIRTMMKGKRLGVNLLRRESLPTGQKIIGTVGGMNLILLGFIMSLFLILIMKDTK